MLKYLIGLSQKCGNTHEVSVLFALASCGLLQKIRKPYFLLILLTLPAVIVHAQNPDSADDLELFPIYQNKKIGYIDRTGKIIIEPKFTAGLSEFNGSFSEARYFQEGLAEVADGGFINTKGEYVITKFKARKHFKNGLAVVYHCPVEISLCTIGFIDRTGKVIVAPIFRDAEHFSEGLAAVNLNGKWGYVDLTGKIVISPRFDNNPGYFQNGFVRVSIRDVRQGYIDRAGEFIPFPDEVESFGELGEGLIGVQVGDKFGFANTRGEIVIKPQFDAVDVFSEGLAAAQLNGKYGYINRNGKLVIPPQFDEAGRFSNGIAAVSANKFSNYIKKDGKPLLAWKYEEVWGFSEGLAAVSKGGKWGFVDLQGKIVIKPQFEYAMLFSDGLAAVVVGKKWGYIDRTGKIVIEPQFISGSYFYKGLARIIIKRFGSIPSPSPGYHNEWGYIDRTGKFVWKSID